MRLWHLALAVVVVGALLAIGRDGVGRVALVVFFTGLAEFLLGTLALTTLFQTVGSIGEARGFQEYAIAVGATVLVLAAATLVMNSVLWVGVSLCQSVIG